MDDSNQQNSTQNDAELQRLLKQLGHAEPLPNKRLAKAYIWLGFLGIFGAHRLYIKSKWGFVQLALGLIGLACIIPNYVVVFTNDIARDVQLAIVLTGVFGFLSLFVVGIWALVDNFLLHGRASPAAETEGKLPGKRLATAFILLNLLGSFGAHRLYLNNWLGGVQLILGLATVVGAVAVPLVAGARLADEFGLNRIETGDVYSATELVIYYVLVAVYFVWYGIIDRIWLYRRA